MPARTVHCFRKLIGILRTSKTIFSGSQLNTEERLAPVEPYWRAAPPAQLPTISRPGQRCWHIPGGEVVLGLLHHLAWSSPTAVLFWLMRLRLTWLMPLWSYPTWGCSPLTSTCCSDYNCEHLSIYFTLSVFYQDSCLRPRSVNVLQL